MKGQIETTVVIKMNLSGLQNERILPFLYTQQNFKSENTSIQKWKTLSISFIN